jgi:hypothetical protein
MNPLERVGFFDTENHFSNVPLRNRLSEYVIADQQTKKISARHVVHDEVETIRILETCNKRYNPVSKLAM